MTVTAAELIWSALFLYLAFGLLVGLLVVFFALKRLEPGSAAMPFRVRAVILPGLAALWPIVLLRLMGLRAKEDRR
jgi:hypothetical protein